MKENDKPEEKEASFSLKEFFETVPPGRPAPIKNMARNKSPYIYSEIVLQNIELCCSNNSCNGPRFFEPTIDNISINPNESKDVFIDFFCRNCGRVFKTYAIRIFLNTDGVNGNMFKYGEDPQYGPPTPSRVISLIGPEKEYFLKGRRAENQGMGIAACAYYRRVIESQKNRIFDEVIRVSEKIGAHEDFISDLTQAKSETRFTKAIDSIKKAIPQVLLIRGQNPLMLLHSALSEGIHDLDDEECLDIATSIRVVLTELSERMEMALKDDTEISAAVTRLIRNRSKK